MGWLKVIKYPIFLPAPKILTLRQRRNPTIFIVGYFYITNKSIQVCL